MSVAPWFMVSEPWSSTEVTLPVDESHHALKVMRVKPPDVITITDGRGTVARAAASRIDQGRLVVEILESVQRRPLKPEVVVYQGAPKGSKADDVIERLAEVGIAETTIFSSTRAVVRWDEERIARLEDRWRSLARAASKQSRNPFVMNIGGALSWDELLSRVEGEPLAIVLWEEASLPLRTALGGSADRVALVIGPEGGFDRAEAEALADAGAQLVSLGPRILRTENAALVAAAALQYHFGLIG
ncbi:MAG: 16S rRNA (uracil(1498)-N(3))-methyltransferase [Actinomycetota bacterium]|nr:16S rRNA (uracil(1498)-N(3))-methyltransferase [Actinomycetota bacterium]